MYRAVQYALQDDLCSTRYSQYAVRHGSLDILLQHKVFSSSAVDPVKAIRRFSLRIKDQFPLQYLELFRAVSTVAPGYGLATPYSTNSVFRDFFRQFLGGILGDVRD